MKFQKRINQLIFIPLILVFFVLGLGSNLSISFALPEGGNVQEGTVTFEQPNSTTLNITTSNQAIINWNSFNIAQNEIVNFYQPLSSSSVLNRVIGGGISEIAGALNANGSVILVNPAGINFTQTANINVGSLIASSLNISDSNFMSSNYVFQNDSGLRAGTVINAGSITSVRPGGIVAMLGGVVENSGSVVAEFGSVALAAGNKITLKFDPQGLLEADVTEGLGAEMLGPDGTILPDAVSNLGRIVAGGGKIIMTAEQVSSVFARLVNMTGYIEANSVVNQNGHILLVAHSGLVRSAGEIHADGSSSNPNGGLVDVLGDKIIQRGFISANALDGGVAGNINVIADTGTLLTDLSHIEARGVSGISHGGVVVVNSLAGSTDFRQFSDINVSGGPVGGDAGFIEVSAKENLNFSGKVYGVAQPGYAGGSILLDPQDITISNAGGNAVAGGNSAPGTADETFAENGAGTNVTYDPRAGGAFNGFNEIFLQASRDIIINSPFSVPTAVGAGGGPNLSLRLEANRHINVNANVSTTTGNITFKADADNSTSGNFTQAAGVSISSTSGNISISGRGTQTVGNISTGGAGTIGITSNNGAVTQRNGTTLQTAGGNVTITAQNGDATVEIINANGGNITVTANGGNDIVRQSAANLLTGNIVTLSANTANGTVGTAAQPINTNATIINASARQTGIFITESDGATLNNITTTNDNIVIISTTGNLSVGTVNAGTANVTLTATAGSILDATSAITGNTVTLTAGGAAGSLGVSATPINTTATTLALTSGSGGAFISNTGSVTLNAPTIGAGGSISVVSSGTLMLPGTALSLGAGNINFASNGGNLTTAANLTTSTGNITLSASGILTVANNLQATGAGNIGLTADNNGAGGESLVWNAGNTIMSAGGNVNLTVGNGATGTGNVNLRTANAGAGNITVISREGSIVEAASGSSSLTGATVTLTSGTGAGDAVGTLVDAINTTATTINATSGTGGIFIDETNAVTLNSITTAGGNVNISAGGNMTLGTVSGGFVSLTTTAGGSILDGNGVANNLTATAGASLTSAGIIGTGTDPLEVNVTGGNLTVAAGGNDLATGISVNINGTVTPSNTLTVSVRPAGRVFFNGVDLFATNTILEITIDGNVIFVNLQERFRSRDEAKDLLSATSDPFVDKKRWTLAPRSQYLKQEYQP